MLPSRNIRWVGTSISSGRRRLISSNISCRHFSINTSHAPTPRSTRLSPPIRLCGAQQSRSLSLFGWGGSSKPSSDRTPSSSNSNIEIGPSTTGLENIRTVKASHATSDAPDTAQAHLHPPNQIEPQIIEDLQQKITLPHGSASERIAEIASGTVEITSASERMGYLKEVCGLDFGWGPSSVMEYIFEYFHVGFGLSWTASIVALAAILRLVMVKPIIDSQIQGKKMREMQPYVKPLREKYMQLMKEGNRAKAMEIGAQMKEINKSANISYTKAFVPLLIQLPFSFGAFRMLRNAGQLPVPAFVTEDWLWTTDLSFSDPYYITPAISAATIYFTFRLQQQQQGQNAMIGPQLMKVLGTGLPILSFGFMAFQPGAVQLYFMTTGFLAFATSGLIRQQWFRNWIDLGPLPGLQSESPATSPGQSTAKKLPAGIQRIAPAYVPPQAAAEVASQAQSNRSVIDKAVDGVKGSWQGIKDSTSGSSLFSKKVADRQRDNQKAASDRYHATRQAQLNREREERNQQARDR